MTTRTVTVLCLQLVAPPSTPSGVASPHHGRRQRAHDLVRAAIDDHRGSVLEGRGDGFLATFDSATDGVAAARAVQLAMAPEPGTTGGEPVEVRAGLSIGDVAFADEGCVGPPVVEASQLCAAAAGGQILATDVLQHMAGMRDDQRIVSLGSRRLPGTSSLLVVEVGWKPPTAWAAPLPSVLRPTSSAFVGREEEIGSLRGACLRAASSRQRSVVLVSGEAGIGKTTLVSRAAQAAHSQGANVGSGSCDEYLRTPYRPFQEALGHLIGSAPIGLLEAHVARCGAGAASLVPGLGARLAHLPTSEATDADSERFLLFAAIGDLLTRMSEFAPIVLLFEDLHWADAATASLLHSIVTDPTPAALLVLATFRDAEVAAHAAVGRALAAIRGLPTVTHLPVGGLRRPDVAQLVRLWPGAPASTQVEPMVTALLDETEGNPFFVVEMLRHLQEAGQLDEATATDISGPRFMPDSVREVLGERVDRLGPELREVLEMGAVIGREFTVSLLSALTGHDEVRLRAMLADAVSVAVVREVADEPATFGYTHALVQRAILANLGTTRQIRIHRRVAEALEVSDGGRHDATQLAHHWLQATRFSDAAKARDWARKAGDAALAALAPADAVAYFDQALALDQQASDRDITTRVDLLTRLGTAKRLAGDPSHRETLLEASELALALSDGGRLTAAVLANHSGTFSRFRGVDDERVAMLRAAVDLAPTPHDRALLQATLTNELTYAGDYPGRRAVAEAALATARSTGDDLLLLRVRSLVFFALWVPETLAERLTMWRESQRILGDVHDPALRFWALTGHSITLLQAGQLGEADRLQDEVDALSDRLAQPALQWRARHHRAARALLSGHADAAEALARDARELGLAAGEPVAEVYFKLQSMCVQWLRGTLSELAQRIRGKSPRPANAVATMCLIFAEGGRTDDARALLEAQAADGFASLPRDPTFLTSMALFAEAAIVLGDPTPAEPLHGLLTPFSRQVGFDGVTTVGLLEHHVGGLAALIGRRDEARARLQRSVDWHADADVPFFEARSRLRLATALLEQGRAPDRLAAREHLTRAADISSRHGFAALLLAAQRAADLVD